MTNREIISNSVRYIENNLREDIRVSDVAREAGYSLYHFIRLFDAVTGFTPKEYILRRKLTEAAKIITATDRRIIDIAFDFEFQTHESFTRAFRRCFGENPADFRKSATPGGTSFLEPFSAPAAISVIPVDIQPDVVTLEAIHLVGFSIFVQDDIAPIARMWSMFEKHNRSIPGKKIPERSCQLSYWTEDPAMNGFFCMAGIETADLSGIPPQMCGKTVPHARYLRFIHRGLSRNVGKTYERIYGEAIPATDYRLSLPYNVEIYGSGYLGPDNPDSESEIYIPVES